MYKKKGISVFWAIMLFFFILTQSGVACCFDDKVKSADMIPFDRTVIPMEESFFIPEKVEPKSGFSLLAAGDISVNHSLTIDEIVAKEKELSHSGFTFSKETQMEIQPQFTAPYSAGSVVQSDLNDAVNALKMVRFLAGLPYNDVYLDEREVVTAQHKAVLLAVSSELKHNPAKPSDMSQDFYNTAMDYQAECIAGGIKNISYSIMAYIADQGKSNIERAGHRMILLRPDLQKFGIGIANNPSTNQQYQYLSAVHVKYDWSETDSYVAWPNAGNFPIQYFIHSKNLSTKPPYPWSISLGSPYSFPNKNNITLKLTRTRDNKEWIFDKNTPNLAVEGLTDSSMHLSTNNENIIFRPDVTSLGAISDGDVFKVELSGIKYINGLDATLDYEIRFFDLDKEMKKSRVNFIVRHNGIAMPGVSITIDGQTLTTDDSGTATIRVENNKSYTYTVTKDGYYTETSSIRVETGEITKTIDIRKAAEIVYKNSEGKVIKNLTNGDVFISYDHQSEQGEDVTLIAALYIKEGDGTNRIVSLKQASVSNSISDTLTVSLKVENKDQCFIKAFLWKSFNHVVPIRRADILKP